MDHIQETQSGSDLESRTLPDPSGGDPTLTKSSPRGIISGPLPGDTERLKWEPLILTPEKAQSLWEQIQKFPQVFDDFSRGNYKDFINKFFIPNNVFIDIGPGIGLAAGFAVKPGLDACLHLVMFDRRLRGREGVFKEIMSHFFKEFKLQRMTAIIADDCLTARKLVQRLGFKEEGCMRRSILRDQQAHDAFVYGILREEL